MQQLIFMIITDLIGQLQELELTHLQHGEVHLEILTHIYLNGLKKIELTRINSIAKISLI